MNIIKNRLPPTPTPGQVTVIQNYPAKRVSVVREDGLGTDQRPWIYILR